MQGIIFIHKDTHHKGWKTILIGTRDKTTGLWIVPLENINNNPKIVKNPERWIDSAYNMTNQTDLVK